MVIEVARAKKQGFKTDSRACISLNHMRKPMTAQSDKEHLYQGNMNRLMTHATLLLRDFRKMGNWELP